MQTARHDTQSCRGVWAEHWPASAGRRGGEALGGQEQELGWGRERTWKNEDLNAWQDPEEKEEEKWGMQRKGPTTMTGRIFYFRVDAGRKISEGTPLPGELERHDSGLHNNR